MRSRTVHIRLAAVPGTKTPCRTITLNKSLPPDSHSARALSLYLFMPGRCCLNRIKTTAAATAAAAIAACSVGNWAPGAPSCPIIENLKGDPIVRAGK